MDLKGFLAPTRTKLLLAAVLYVPFAPVFEYCVFCFLPGNCPGCRNVSFLEAILGIYPAHSLTWAFALGGLPFAYLASCFLVFLAQKQQKH